MPKQNSHPHVDHSDSRELKWNLDRTEMMLAGKGLLMFTMDRVSFSFADSVRSLVVLLDHIVLMEKK